MRFFKTIQTTFHDVWYNSSETFVYFLLSFINPLVLLIFWRGSFGQSDVSSFGWTISDITTYYLLLIIASAMLTAHIEYDVAYEDIQQGGLTRYLLRPFYYFLFKLGIEIPWRVVQGAMGILCLFIYVFILHGKLAFVGTIPEFIGAVLIALLGFCLSFLFKMIVGFTAFWTTDFSGIQQAVEVVLLMSAGYVLPLIVYPDAIKPLILVQPFAYMIYYPVIAFLGKIPLGDMVPIVGIQFLWIIFFFCVALVFWKRGVRLFTGVGN